ncbi:MAG: hypothetical protein GC171_14025 [Terrimonas sp.]|nr:hypothetical protein [Terrimonas sp.]
MLIIFFIQLILLLCFAGTGFLIEHFRGNPPTGKHPVILAINGLIFFTAVAQIIALFLPVNLTTGVIIFLLIILIACLKKNFINNLINYIQSQSRSLPLSALLLIIASWMIMIMMAAGPILMDDTDSYHIQMIKWIQEYGSVPGIVNLHSRFGFNSSWFSSVALLGYSSSTFNLYTTLNSFLSFLFCYYLVSRIFDPTLSFNTRSGFILVFVASIVLWPLTRGNSATSNYDFITTVTIFILFAETWLAPKNSLLLTGEWFIWPAYLFTVRIINAPLLLISMIAFMMLVKRKEISKILICAGAMTGLILPFLIRNIIVSGFPFYPVTALGFIHVDWQPNASSIDELLFYIKYYNRVGTAYLDLAQTESLGNWGWIPTWFRYLFIYDKIILLAGMAGLVSGFMYGLRSRQKLSPARMIFFVLWIQLVVWFLIAPDPRFVYGPLLCGVLLLPVIWPEKIFRCFSIRSISIGSSAFGLAIIFFLALKASKDNAYRNWIRPLSLPVPTVNSIQIDGIPMNIPEKMNDNWNTRCYGTALPCIYALNPKLEPRGKKIKDGFRVKK